MIRRVTVASQACLGLIASHRWQNVVGKESKFDMGVDHVSQVGVSMTAS